MSDNLEERLRRRQKESVTAQVREIERLDAEESAPPPPPPPKPKSVKKSIGLGQPSFDVDAAVAKILRRAAATTDPVLKAKLLQRAKDVKKNAE